MVKFSFLWVDKSTFFSSSEDLFEVKFLTNISDINYSIAFELLYSISNGSQISSCITESSIRLLNDNWRGLLFANEYALSSVILNNHFRAFKFFHHRLQSWVVKTLSLLK
jgi:hypothetical protein